MGHDWARDEAAAGFSVSIVQAFSGLKVAVTRNEGDRGKRKLNSKHGAEYISQNLCLLMPVEYIKPPTSQHLNIDTNIPMGLHVSHIYLNWEPFALASARDSCEEVGVGLSTIADIEHQVKFECLYSLGAGSLAQAR